MVAFPKKVVILLPFIWCFFIITPVVNKTTAFEDFNCTCLPPVCVNMTTQFTKVDRFKSTLSFYAVIAQIQTKIEIRIKKYTKMGKAGWKPGNIDVKFDYCLFANGLRVPIIDVFAPGLRPILEKTVRPCPFVGEFAVENYTVVADTYPTISPVGFLTRTNIHVSNEKLLSFINCYVYGKVYL